MKHLLATATAVLLLSTVAACGSDASDGSTDRGDGPEARTLTVFAAASLKTSFEEMKPAFEEANPGVTVELNFAGSSDLVAQIQGGAPADVFASADTKNMDKATGDDLVDGTPADFAKNTLEIVTPPDNPGKVDSIDDLANGDLQVVLCAPEVPCGAAAEGVEKAAGIDIEPVSEEQSVTDVLNKVAAGEADAGLVYVTDVKAAGDSVLGVEFPESADVVNTYPIAALSGSKDVELAQAFADYVVGPKGQAVLAAAGFAKP